MTNRLIYYKIRPTQIVYLLFQLSEMESDESLAEISTKILQNKIMNELLKSS